MTTPHKNGSFIQRCRFYASKGFSYADIGQLMKCKASDAYIAVHGRKRPKQRAQTPSDAVAELLADGCDPAIVAANFGAT